MTPREPPHEEGLAVDFHVFDRVLEEAEIATLASGDASAREELLRRYSRAVQDTEEGRC